MYIYNSKCTFFHTGAERPIHDENPDVPGAETEDQDALDAAAPDESDEEEEDACRFCFLSPCCTSYNHDFIGGGQAASNENPAIRKVRYKKYWSVISNLGG